MTKEEYIEESRIEKIQKGQGRIIEAMTKFHAKHNERSDNIQGDIRGLTLDLKELKEKYGKLPCSAHNVQLKAHWGLIIAGIGVLTAILAMVL